MVLGEVNEILLGEQPINKAYIGGNLIYEKFNAHLVDEWVFNKINNPLYNDLNTIWGSINNNRLDLVGFEFVHDVFNPLPGSWIKRYELDSNYGLWFDSTDKVDIDLHALIGENEPYTVIAEIEKSDGTYQLTNITNTTGYPQYITCTPRNTQRIVIGYSFDGITATPSSDGFIYGLTSGTIGRYLYLSGSPYSAGNKGEVIYRKLTLYKGTMTRDQINREIANRYQITI